MSRRFPYQVWRSIGAAAAGDCVTYVYTQGRLAAGAELGELILSGDRDRIQVTSARGDQIATLGGGLDSRKKGTLDEEGFASAVFDDVIQIATTITAVGILYIAGLHRSGTVQVWTYENPAESQDAAGSQDVAESQDVAMQDGDTEKASAFKPVASWMFSAPGGAPRWLECHNTVPVVAVASSNGRCKVYDMTTGALTHNFEGLLINGDQCSLLRFHQTRVLLLLGSSTGVVHVMDLCRNVILVSAQAHSTAVLDAAFVDINLPLGKTNGFVPCFLTVGGDRQVKLWSLKTVLERVLEKCKQKHFGASKELRHNGFIDLGHPVHALELLTASNTPDASKNANGAKRMALAAENTSAVKKVMEADSSLRILDKCLVAMSAKETYASIVIVPRAAVEEAIIDQAFLQNAPGWFALAGTEAGAVVMLDVVRKQTVPYRTSAAQAYQFHVPRPPIRRLFKSPKNDAFVVITTNQGLVHWRLNAPSLEPNKALRGVGTSSSAAVGMVLAPTPTPAGVPKDVASTGPVGRCSVTYSCGIDGSVIRERVIWDRGECEVTEMLVNSDEVIAAVDMSECGRYLAFVTKLGRLCVVDMEQGMLVAACRTGAVGSLTNTCFSQKPVAAEATTIAAGQPFVATVGSDNFIRLWVLNLGPENLKSGQSPASNPGVPGCEFETSTVLWKAADKPVYCVAVNGSNKVLASGGADRTVRLWRPSDGKALAVLKGHKAAVTALAFHPAEPYLASASVDGTLRIWNLKTHECQQTIMGATNHVLVLKYIMQGNRLAAGCADGSVQAWDVSSTLAVEYCGTSLAHDDRITTLMEASFADQPALISVAADGSSALWRDRGTEIKQEETAHDRAQRNDRANADIWIAQGQYARAIRAACKWKSVDIFEKVVAKLIESTTLEISTFETEHGVSQNATGPDLDLVQMIREEFKTVEDIEVLLLAAVHFCKRQSTLYIAHWICDSIIQAYK
ncbi:putative WD40 domain protein [Gregarina niphandrodes]|uniref:WD40 domain protein n=1 Tax=Gregarina niphandrodes TaxID=110365 RepID=A0A023AZZ2_GRENI|nr:putative WD40 domain protein [Gregarina niphandrodes]EZG44829.1 putative WD40 domain protein [Gregarina niphandrodes]|eukprot:XP_011132653.1 putative WD40 domain protein [Gregarina niphandrodes]